MKQSHSTHKYFYQDNLSDDSSGISDSYLLPHSYTTSVILGSTFFVLLKNESFEISNFADCIANSIKLSLLFDVYFSLTSATSDLLKHSEIVALEYSAYKKKIKIIYFI